QASRGCVRLPHPFAVKLYRLTRLGARVIIAPNAPVPEDIAHVHLFVRKPAPPPEPLEPGSAKSVAIAAASEMTTAIANARVGKSTAEPPQELATLPLSVPAGKADGKAPVRHGFRQISEPPAIIRDPDRALGTHVYTALELKDDGGTMRWQAISLPASGQTAAN